MKVFLINPPAKNLIKVVREGRCMQRKGAWTAVWSPLSLALCATVLEQEGIEVSLLDYTVKEGTPEQLMSQISSRKPDLVVLNVTTPSIEDDLKMVAMIKQACPETRTAILGIHPTALPNECFNACKELDYIIRREPEFTLRELCRAIKCSPDIPVCDPSAIASEGQEEKHIDLPLLVEDSTSTNKHIGLPLQVQGISFRNGDKIIHNPPRPWLDMDDLPFPAWHLIDTSDYIMPFHNVPFLLVATSRGCPYPCTFCADSTYYGRGLRQRSPKRLVDELEWAGKEFGIYEFLFWSESFTLSRKFVMAVCDEIIKRQ
ncbi:cobalamin B12-binding domain-containing protein, partial [Candidatus Desantisbacteria bacterium]|nr:cobalamin B12-binding domain-containing protein [Candidatus Desantisbacteria bacterium]